MIEYRAPNAEWTKNYGLSTAALTGRYMFNGAMALDVDKLKRLDEADTVANEVIFCLNKLKTTIGNEGFGPESIVGDVRIRVAKEKENVHSTEVHR